ncbi:MAG: glycosyltransferase family 4 protein, partial [Algoriphagus sp.]
MKIVQLVDSLDLGGTERMSVNIANSLADYGVESHLFVTRNLGGLVDFVSPAVNLKAFGKKSTFDLLTFFDLLKNLRNVKPDILHVHQTSIFWAILLKPFLSGTRLIWHDHFGQSEMLDQYPRKEMNFIIPFLSAVITVNTKIKDFWVEKIPSKAARIYFLRNFPQLQEIERAHQDSAKITLVNVANIRRQKDQLTLIESLKHLKSFGFQFKAYLIGEVVDEDWLEEIKAMILKHDMAAEVEVVGPVNNVVPYLKSATMGILSSESEGLPVALLEYGMAALPTVATRVGQCEAVMGFGEFGWLVPVKSPVEMAHAMREIIENPSKAKKLGELLKSNVVENYGVKNFMDQYLKIVSEISNSSISEI